MKVNRPYIEHLGIEYLPTCMGTPLRLFETSTHQLAEQTPQAWKMISYSFFEEIQHQLIGCLSHYLQVYTYVNVWQQQQQLVLHWHHSPYFAKKVCNWVVYCKYLTGIELLDLVAQSVNGWESWKAKQKTIGSSPRHPKSSKYLVRRCKEVFGTPKSLFRRCLGVQIPTHHVFGCLG